MKKNTNNLVILILLFLCFGCVSKKEIPQELESTYALLNRLLPDRANQFEFNIIPSKDNKDIFEIDSSNSKIIINTNDACSQSLLSSDLKFWFSMLLAGLPWLM